MGRFLPADHSKGDANTLGGYMAVHDRPAAFEGADGASYSVAIETDETGDAAAPYGAYLFFVRWSRGDPSPAGHLESDFLTRAASAEAAAAELGRLRLSDVKRVLDELIARQSRTERPWWEAMRDEGDV